MNNPKFKHTVVDAAPAIVRKTIEVEAVEEPKTQDVATFSEKTIRKEISKAKMFLESVQIKDGKDKETYLAISETRKALVKVRTGMVADVKEFLAPIKKIVKDTSATEKQLIAELKAVEAIGQAKEDVYTADRDRIKQEEDNRQTDRSKVLKDWGAMMLPNGGYTYETIDGLALSVTKKELRAVKIPENMMAIEDDFLAREEIKATKAAEEKAEQDRKDKELADLKAKAAADKAEQERKDAEAAAELKKQQEAHEAELLKMRVAMRTTILESKGFTKNPAEKRFELGDCFMKYGVAFSDKEECFNSVLNSIVADYEAEQEKAKEATVEIIEVFTPTPLSAIGGQREPTPEEEHEEAICDNYIVEDTRAIQDEPTNKYLEDVKKWFTIGLEMQVRTAARVDDPRVKEQNDQLHDDVNAIIAQLKNLLQNG